MKEQTLRFINYKRCEQVARAYFDLMNCSETREEAESSFNVYKQQLQINQQIPDLRERRVHLESTLAGHHREINRLYDLIRKS
jgi:hypothetical protein